MLNTERSVKVVWACALGATSAKATIITDIRAVLNGIEISCVDGRTQPRHCEPSWARACPVGGVQVNFAASLEVTLACAPLMRHVSVSRVIRRSMPRASTTGAQVQSMARGPNAADIS